MKDKQSTNEITKECANWLNYDAIRNTVEEYEQRWGAKDSEPVILTERQMTLNCMECNLKPKLSPSLKTLTQIMEIFKEHVMVELEKAGMVRKCFKPIEEKHNASK